MQVTSTNIAQCDHLTVHLGPLGFESGPLRTAPAQNDHAVNAKYSLGNKKSTITQLIKGPHDAMLVVKQTLKFIRQTYDHTIHKHVDQS